MLEFVPQSAQVISTRLNVTCRTWCDWMRCNGSLSPCGHVLCLKCLQTWFRTEPSSDDLDVDNSDDSDSSHHSENSDNSDSSIHSEEDDSTMTRHRQKLCSVCRTRVVGKPIPAYVIKTMTSVLKNASLGGTGRTERRAWACIMLCGIADYGVLAVVQLIPSIYCDLWPMSDPLLS